MSSGGSAWAGLRATCALAPLVAVLLTVTPAAASTPLGISASGSNGVGSIVTPGRPCSDGGAGAYRHYNIETPIAGGLFSQLPGELRGTIDEHDDPALGKGAFLLPNESHSTLANERGAVRLGLTTSTTAAPGPCVVPTLSLSGTTLSGSGNWTVINGTGAYRQATGNGTFNVRAILDPGADNPWSLSLNGSLSVLQPTLQVTVDHTYWANFGLDYISNIVTVVYKISNRGPGDSFNVVLQSTASSASGVTALGPTPQAVGDLLANQSALVKVRYRLSTGHPCPITSANLNCSFPTTATVLMPDALDVGTPQTQTVTVTTPASPLVLS